MVLRVGFSFSEKIFQKSIDLEILFIYNKNIKKGEKMAKLTAVQKEYFRAFHNNGVHPLLTGGKAKNAT